MKSFRKNKYQPKHLAPKKTPSFATKRPVLLVALTVAFCAIAIGAVKLSPLLSEASEAEESVEGSPIIITSEIPEPEEKQLSVKIEPVYSEKPAVSPTLLVANAKFALANLKVEPSPPPAPTSLEEAEENFRMDLDWIKENLHFWYAEDEIREVSLIVKAEAEVCQSDTEWAAHVWVILSRVGTPGFEQNDSIHGILTAPHQFPTYTAENLAAEENPDIRRIVIDVMARFVLEEHGAPEAMVGRVMPRSHLFWDCNEDNTHNIFYKYCWGDPYDPHDAPYNPYSN